MQKIKFAFYKRNFKYFWDYTHHIYWLANELTNKIHETINICISGAIQNLAGVNRSKVIALINKDPEAPFFKAGDYRIVGDAFEILRQITTEIKNIKEAS